MRAFSALVMIACGGETVVEKQSNQLPSVQIQSHADEVVVQEGYTESLRALVSDGDHDLEELQVAWFSGETVICDWAAPSVSGDTYCSWTPQPSDEQNRG